MSCTFGARILLLPTAKRIVADVRIGRCIAGLLRSATVRYLVNRGLDCTLASYTGLADRSPGASSSSEFPFQLSGANSPGAYRLKPAFMKERLDNPAATSTTASRKILVGSQVAMAICTARSCTGARAALPEHLAASTQIGHTRQALRSEASVPAMVNCARCRLHTAYSGGPAHWTVLQALVSG